MRCEYEVFLSISTGINALIGEACEVDKNCISAQMVCGSNRLCVCMRGHYPTEDRKNCIASELREYRVLTKQGNIFICR
jgi:hypothetical protein